MSGNGDEFDLVLVRLAQNFFRGVALRHDASSQSNLVHKIAPGVYFRDAEPDKRIIANTGWIVYNGTYSLFAGDSSRSLPLRVRINVRH